VSLSKFGSKLVKKSIKLAVILGRVVTQNLAMLAYNLDLQRFKVLFGIGNYSGILSRLN
jgi:hypothetical protein